MIMIIFVLQHLFTIIIHKIDWHILCSFLYISIDKMSLYTNVCYRSTNHDIFISYKKYVQQKSDAMFTVHNLNNFNTRGNIGIGTNIFFDFIVRNINNKV